MPAGHLRIDIDVRGSDRRLGNGAEITQEKAVRALAACYILHKRPGQFRTTPLRADTVAVTRDPPRHHGIPDLAMTQQLLLGAGKDDRVRSCCVHLEDNPSEAPMLRGR